MELLSWCKILGCFFNQATIEMWANSHCQTYLSGKGIMLKTTFFITLSHQCPARRPKPVEQGVIIFTIHKLNDLHLVFL